jgi:hypothetical protein
MASGALFRHPRNPPTLLKARFVICGAHEVPNFSLHCNEHVRQGDIRLGERQALHNFVSRALQGCSFVLHRHCPQLDLVVHGSLRINREEGRQGSGKEALGEERAQKIVAGIHEPSRENPLTENSFMSPMSDIATLIQPSTPIWSPSTASDGIPGAIT